MIFGNILHNHVLLTGLAGWLLAQMLKIPIEFVRSHRWNWALFFGAGGMPSSHSALVTSTAAAVGLFYGFDNQVFGVATAIAMIVVYDATGIRREVLGHTPLEAMGGVLLGLVVALGLWLVWR
jgi:acid phosphatase family membrane protein YuiD